MKNLLSTRHLLTLALYTWGKALAEPFRLDDRCDDSSTICLTSFVYCRDLNGIDCDYPNDVVTVTTGALVVPAYTITDNYTLSWTKADPDRPINVTFGTVTLANLTAGTQNFTFSFQDILAKTSEGQDILKELLNVELHNLEVRQYNVSQPTGSAGSFKDGSVIDSTTSFLLIDWNTAGQIQNDKDRLRNTERKWRLGVGVGIGIGVPLLLAGAFLIGNSFGRRNYHSKTVELQHTQK